MATKYSTKQALQNMMDEMLLDIEIQQAFLKPLHSVANEWHEVTDGELVVAMSNGLSDETNEFFQDDTDIDRVLNDIEPDPERKITLRLKQ